MELDISLEFSDHAKRRMLPRGLTERHIWYCLEHGCEEYKVGKDTVWGCQLPDGRNMKVRVRDASANPIYIIDAFTSLPLGGEE